ncbi:Pecanex-like protein 2 [Frankliniella fusca]|uniref:Pecanex-like protein 2 n=1 Tax=Frankliniella fusca TaxID=407009 RepID=A0AAE1I4F1_9NEOP|nr:Pecanex-like protein 2 [Frankliniella fusca]KAK3933149.1 Pecanex-like protein 2 [Frankliniella fusca]
MCLTKSKPWQKPGSLGHSFGSLSMKSVRPGHQKEQDKLIFLINTTDDKPFLPELPSAYLHTKNLESWIGQQYSRRQRLERVLEHGGDMLVPAALCSAFAE